MLPLTCISGPSSFIFQKKIKESQWKLTGFHETEHNPSEVWELLLWSWQTGIFLFFFFFYHNIYCDSTSQSGPAQLPTCTQRGKLEQGVTETISANEVGQWHRCALSLWRGWTHFRAVRLTGADSTQVSSNNSEGYQLTHFWIGAPKGCAELNLHITWRVLGSQDKS